MREPRVSEDSSRLREVRFEAEREETSGRLAAIFVATFDSEM